MTDPATTLHPPPDAELLHRYATAGDRAAFDALAGRYVHFVYATARREMGGDAHAADDVTQAVFLVLARRAGSVPPRQLGGWLFRATRYCCANARKLAARRSRHERRAAAARPEVVMPTAPADDDAHPLLPLLDAALASLRPADREAVILRYLRNQPGAAVAAALGVSEPAARKRTERALGRLRDYFAARGITTASVPTVTAALSLASADAAPAATVAAVTATVATAVAPAATALTKGVATMLFWTNAKAAAAVLAVLAVLTTAGVEVARRAAAQGTAATRTTATAPAGLQVRPVAEGDGAAGPATAMDDPLARGPAARVRVLDDVLLDGSAVAAAEARLDNDHWGVAVTFTPAGGDALERWTRANVGRRVAFVLDGRLLSAPAVMAPIRAGYIAVGPAGQVTREQAEAVARRIAPAPAPAAQRRFVGTLANGVSVELLGVGENPSAGRPWWRPDGSPLAAAPYATAPNAGETPRPGHLAREFAFAAPRLAVAGDAGPASLRWDHAGFRGAAIGPPADANGRGRPDLFCVVSDPPADRPVTLRAMVAAGAWATAATGTPAGGGGADGAGATLSAATDAGGSATVTARDTLVGRDARVTATTADGRTVVAAQVGGDIAGNVRTSTWRFGGVPAAALRATHFQIRPFDQWIEFRAVSLRPGERTDVEVVTSDAATDDERAVAGGDVIARFDVVLDAADAEAVRAVTAVVDAPAGFFAVRRGRADAVLAAMRAAFDGGRVPMSDRQVGHAPLPAARPPPQAAAPGRSWSDLARAVGPRDSTPAPGSPPVRPSVTVHVPQFWDNFRRGPLTFGLGLTWSGGDATATAADGGGVRLRLLSPAVEAFVQEYASEPREVRSRTAAVDVDAAVAPGECVVLLGDFGPIRGQHFVTASVWQAYRATDAQQPAMSGIRDAASWVQFGPSGARQAIDRAAAWAGGRTVPAERTPERWTRRLDNKAIVRLVAQGRPQRWPFCWWDADGRPVAGQWHDPDVGLVRTPRAVVYHVRRPADPPRPGERPRPGEPRADVDVSERAIEIPADDRAVEVWVAAGPYHEERVDPGERLELGDGAVTFTRGMPAGNMTLGLLRGDLGPGVEVWLDAVTADGRRVSHGGDRAVVVATSATPRWSRADENLQVKAGDVDHYVLRWRFRQRAAFADFAAEPTPPPPTP